MMHENEDEKGENDQHPTRQVPVLSPIQILAGPDVA